ncbi:MAG: ABC-2 family transporter protein [Patescibacteria group bacterium]
MGLYFRVFYFEVLRYFTYPLEMVAIVIRRAVDVGFFVLFWIAVAHSSNGTIDTREIISYILIARSITGITGGTGLMFSGFINHLIRRGDINNYLIKPVSLIPYFYSMFSGERAITAIVSLVTLVIGIAIGSAALTPINFLLFLAYFVVGFFIITLCNVLVGIISFYVTDSAPLRWSIGHVFNVFSGAMIPLSLFPHVWQKILLLSPFPMAVYGSASVFAPSTLTFTHLQMFIVGITWVIILWVVTNYLWKRALRSYDAIGI